MSFPYLCHLSPALSFVVTNVYTSEETFTNRLNSSLWQREDRKGQKSYEFLIKLLQSKFQLSHPALMIT